MTLPDILAVLSSAAAISFVVGILIVLSKRWHGKLSLDHDTSSVQKFHADAVPRIGGIALLAGLYFAIGICTKFIPGIFPAEHGIVAVKLIVSSLPIFVAGLVEDLTKRVSVKVRLSAAFLSALVASAYVGATATQLDIWGLDHLLTITPIAIVVTAVMVAGGINAINIIDGFNGLAASTVIIMITALGYIAWQTGDIQVTNLALLLLGAAIGFIAVNYPTGRIFLGDSGAYLLGFWTVEIALLLLMRNPQINAWQLLAICGYPVIEVLYSIYRRRFVRKTNPGAPDALHLHTLIYRRLTPRLINTGCKMLWLQNAIVALIVSPVVAVLTLISVMLGTTVSSAIAVLAIEILLYVVAYTRLVRGRWLWKPSIKPKNAEDMNAGTT